MRSYRLAAVLLLAMSFLALPAAEPRPAGAPQAAGEPRALIPADGSGWTFDNGREFAGAVGSLALDDSVEPQRKPALALHGDFTKGGNYVQAGVPLAGDFDRLAWWFKTPGGAHATARLIDATGQCHQLVLRLGGATTWQHLELPIERFFTLIADGQSLPLVERYEHWGGAGDGKWHGPAKQFFILVGRDTFAGASGTVWLSGVQALPAAPTAPATRIIQEVRLDDFLREGEVDWKLSLGTEFPGAQGTLTAVADQPAAGEHALRLQGDFSKGGAYISAEKDLGGVELQEIRLRVRSTVAHCGVRLIDGTGQCHQSKGFALSADGQWHDVVIKPSEIAGGEHWGGANDGKWHGAAKLLALNIGKTGELLLSDIRALVVSTAQVAAPAYQEGFEGGAALPAGWQVEGDVTVGGPAAAGECALRFARPLSAVDTPTRASGAWFPATSGPWSVGGAATTQLHSPDASFCLEIGLEAGDASGKVLARREVKAPFGSTAWQRFASAVDLPDGTTQARFAITLAKADGTAQVDALSAAPVTQGTRGDAQIDRLVLSTPRIGNLLFPEDPVAFTVDVPVKHPLPAARMTVQGVVRDFWGAEVGAPLTAQLTRGGFADGRMTYRATLDFSAQNLEIGKYYELHVTVPGGPATEHSGFARLPLAETKALPPGSVPFTIRSWDGRIREYVQLADRLGIRQFGLWGHVANAAPYQPSLPQGDLVQELGGTWLTGTEAGAVEHDGFKKVTEQGLRDGMTAFLQQFAGKGLQALCQGNEPPEDPSKVAEKVRAYKAIYEAVKAFDPKITVIATSVGANEAFFSAGFQNWCDAYDFHVYESYHDVRRAMQNYKAMMAKYNAVKPIHCTELGLNSQGMSRHTVAVEMVKKFASFFAEGGVSVSWFGIMYPDKEGTSRGSSGSAHNVFDCQYSRYNPKLDAVMYYQMVNGIAARKFVGEQTYADGSDAYLFRDAGGACFQILWNDRGAVTAQIPLPGADHITLLRVDGSSLALVPHDGGVTLRVSPEPVLLRFHQAEGALATQLAAPRLQFAGAVPEVVKGGSVDLDVTGPELTAATVRVVAPLGWQSSSTSPAAGTVRVHLTAPAETAASEGRVALQRLDGSGVSGELMLDVVLRSPVEVVLLPYAARGDQPGGIALTLRNRGTEARTVSWSTVLEGAFPLAKGSYRLADPQVPQAVLVGDTDGSVELAAGAERSVRLALRDADALTIYRATVAAHDEQGKQMTVSRYIGGFGHAPHATSALTLDGKLDEAVWAQAPVLPLDRAEQLLRYGVNQQPPRAWGGVAELSAGLRVVWDERNLYLGVTVRDDVYRATGCDSGLWTMDGIQLLVDPYRAAASKAGKYDYTLGVGTKGPQAWCHLSAQADVASGLVPEITVVMSPVTSAGDRTYEIAIPWGRLAPFAPKPGADLGLCLIVNDDDGQGRDGFIGWFSGAHLKEVDMVGDIILGE